MLWYGSKPNFYKVFNPSVNKANLFHLKKKKNSLNFFKRNVYNLSTFFMYVPSIWKISLFKNIELNYFFIFFYSKTFFFFLPLNNSFISFKFNQSSSCISFLYFYKSYFFLNFFYYFKKIFYAFSKIFFKKLKFRGKGYYVYKNKRNTVALQFGYSHIKRLFFFYNFVKFLSKTSIVVFGLNPNMISKTAHHFKNTRPINIFTGKGVRFTRQIIYRKTGKVSNYR